jgi:hypothetical protein
MDRHLAEHPDHRQALFLAIQAIYNIRSTARSVESPRQDSSAPAATSSGSAPAVSARV